MKKNFLKTGSTDTTLIIDKQTSEIMGVDIKKHKYLANTKEEFFLMYSSILGLFMQMEQSEIRVYGFLLRYVGNVEFAINKQLREEIAKQSTLNERTVYNTLDKLVRKGLLHKDNKLYRINPEYAYKGSTDKRKSYLKYLLELKCEDK